MLELALLNRGKLGSAHYNYVELFVLFQWATVCDTEEEAEMLEIETAPGQPYGLRFNDVTSYQSSNQDNLQIGYLADVKIAAAGSALRCTLRFNIGSEDLGDEADAESVEFHFKEWSTLIAPERK